MFCNLDAEALRDFGSIGVQANLPKGAMLFREDGPSHGVFVICTGQVKLSCTSREGRTLILKIAMPGDVLGLGAVISGSTYEVTAETIEPTQIKSIRRETSSLFFRNTVKQASMPLNRCQRSTKRHSSMRDAWRYPVRRQAGLREYCSTGGGQRPAASLRCALRWRSHTRNWPTWSVALERLSLECWDVSKGRS